MNTFDLTVYARDLEDANLLENATSDTPIPIKGLTYDSRNVEEGTLFVCKGAAFKRDYLLDAIRRGAVAYVAEEDYQVDLPGLIVRDIRKSMPYLAQRFFERPQDSLKIIGLTGTKGKSTTTYYLKEMLNDWMKAQGKPEVGVISSVRTYDGIVDEESHLTTPESIELYRHLANARASGIEYVVMEVSSQALKYNRLDGIPLFASAFLNISEDHISPVEHKDFEDYFSSKLRIFEHSNQSVLNLDQEHFPRILHSANTNKLLLFSTQDEHADIYADKIQQTELGYTFKVTTKDFRERFEIGMRGLFNIENALCAIGLAMFTGCPLSYMKSGLKRARTAGRMEFFQTADKKIAVYVDYAHNKLSFEKLFETAEHEFPSYQKVIVFGAPGKKAYTRRRDLGTLAGKYADYSYLTEEDAGFEPVQDICHDIAQYIESEGGDYEIIEDRPKAIRTAFHAIEEPTVLLVTGKGDETTMKRQDRYEEIEPDVHVVEQLVKEYDERKC